jgi:4-alpha-glucanotransferase
MGVGLYQDLAVGSSPAGADVWGDRALYARGVAIGAPPDPLGPDGQNWGLPPWNPRALAARGYRDWARLVRAGMAHAGALRIDHALGLFRQFWIPDGMSGRDGAYVRFPADDLLGVLALESVRADGGRGALVVGEDLGTVPPEVGPALARWGVLSSKVLYFERVEGGAFRPPRAYPATALATVNTHDLAPLAGWWAGRDVELRHEVGQLADDGLEAARDERARDRLALVRMLAAEGALDAGALGDDLLGAEALEGAPEGARPTGARPTRRWCARRCTARCAAAPSWLVGLALEDLVGEPEPVNMPGVAGDRFESWTRRLRVALEDLAATRRSVACSGERPSPRRRPTGRGRAPPAGSASVAPVPRSS